MPIAPVILTRESRVLEDLPLLATGHSAVGFSIPTDDDKLRQAFEPGADTGGHGHLGDRDQRAAVGDVMAGGDLFGFDLGAGAVHLLAAGTDVERRTILKAIGPVWDGNEVWLLAAGGTLYFAFPALYASSFSGFYLPLMMVLWLLMIRGIGIEFRGHVNDALWKSFFDVAFSLSSLLLAVFFGAALGNVIRGVPLNSEGYFFEPLWTTFTVSSTPGILDWYTILTGLIGAVVLASHGSLYIAAKTQGTVNAKARHVAARFHRRDCRCQGSPMR